MTERGEHTPGPWGADEEHGLYAVFDADGKPLATLFEPAMFAGRNRPYDRAEANARLIAAAPELLALLVESQTSIGGDWRDRRDATIAKARGGAE